MIDAESSPAHQPEVPHMPSPPAQNETPQTTAAVEEVAIRHEPQPQSYAERVVEHDADSPAVVLPAQPVSRAPVSLPSDLEQIETDAEKLRVAATKVEIATSSRPPRVRPPLPSITNEPLKQVETRAK